MVTEINKKIDFTYFILNFLSIWEIIFIIILNYFVIKMSYQASPIRGLDSFSYRETVERNPYKVET
jgi:hypothetical protein